MVIYKTLEYLNQISRRYYYIVTGEKYVFFTSGNDFDSPLWIKSFKLFFNCTFRENSVFSAEIHFLRSLVVFVFNIKTLFSIKISLAKMMWGSEAFSLKWLLTFKVRLHCVKHDSWRSVVSKKPVTKEPMSSFYRSWISMRSVRACTDVAEEKVSPLHFSHYNWRISKVLESLTYYSRR